MKELPKLPDQHNKSNLQKLRDAPRAHKAPQEKVHRACTLVKVPWLNPTKAHERHPREAELAARIGGRDLRAIIFDRQICGRENEMDSAESFDLRSEGWRTLRRERKTKCTEKKVEFGDGDAFIGLVAPLDSNDTVERDNRPLWKMLNRRSRFVVDSREAGLVGVRFVSCSGATSFYGSILLLTVTGNETRS
ncbi:hypothetical protein ACLOJK_018124 [Asimina triloba]